MQRSHFPFLMYPIQYPKRHVSRGEFCPKSGLRGKEKRVLKYPAPGRVAFTLTRGTGKYKSQPWNLIARTLTADRKNSYR